MSSDQWDLLDQVASNDECHWWDHLDVSISDELNYFVIYLLILLATADQKREIREKQVCGYKLGNVERIFCIRLFILVGQLLYVQVLSDVMFESC